MIRINEDLAISNEGLRAMQARPLQDKNKYIITLTYNDNKTINFNVENKEEKNEAMAMLTDGKVATALKRQTRKK